MDKMTALQHAAAAAEELQKIDLRGQARVVRVAVQASRKTVLRLARFLAKSAAVR